MSEAASAEPVDAEIVIEARRDPPMVTEHALDRERVEETPGTFEDPIRLVQALPGVAVTPEYSPAAGDLAIRGAGPGENRYTLDGIEIPYLYHFNGYSSVFHTRLLQELRLAPSTFDARGSGATGALVETESTWDPPERVRGSVNLNAIMAGAEAAVPLGRTWSARASSRRTFLDLGPNTSDQYTVFPSSWDWFGRVEHRPGAEWRLGMLTFGAGDSYSRYAGEPELLDPYEDTLNPELSYRRDFQVAALVHERQGARARWRGSLAYTHRDVAVSLTSASESIDEHRVALRQDLVTSPRPGHVLAAGVEASASALALDVDADRAWPELEQESALLVRGMPGTDRLCRLVAGAYGEWQWTLGAVRLVPGLRVDGDSGTGALVADPRLALRWEFLPDTRAKLGGGWYSQFPRSAALAPNLGNAVLAVARSRQVATGVETAIAGRLELGADAYYIVTEDVVVEDPGGPPRNADRWSTGVEVVSRYRLRETIFAMASLALGRSETGGVTSDYDQPWAANVAASWDFLPTWNAGLRFRAAEGLPHTPIVDGQYQGASDTYAPISGATNSARLPAYSKVDAHLEKVFPLRGDRSLEVYAELWWVPAGSNTMYLVYSYDFDASAAVHGPEWMPLLGVRAEL
jgi:hypothetical protein